MPILITESGIVTDVNPVQPSNALSPIIVTTFPIVTLVNFGGFGGEERKEKRGGIEVIVAVYENPGKLVSLVKVIDNIVHATLAPWSSLYSRIVRAEAPPPPNVCPFTFPPGTLGLY